MAKGQKPLGRPSLLEAIAIRLQEGRRRPSQIRENLRNAERRSTGRGGPGRPVWTRPVGPSAMSHDEPCTGRESECMPQILSLGLCGAEVSSIARPWALLTPSSIPNSPYQKRLQLGTSNAFDPCSYRTIHWWVSQLGLVIEYDHLEMFPTPLAPRAPDDWVR